MVFISTEPNSRHMRAVAGEIFILLFGNGDWIGEEPNFLVVSSRGHQRTSWVYTHAVDVRIINILMNLLHTETKFC